MTNRQKFVKTFGWEIVWKDTGEAIPGHCRILISANPSFDKWLNEEFEESNNKMNELTKDEAYAVAEFIDINIFTAIRSDEEWDSFHHLRNLCHAYEKCCDVSGYVGVTDSAEGGQDNGSD